MTKLSKYKTSKWSQSPRVLPGCSQRAEVHCTSLPCPLAPAHPAGGDSPLPGPRLWMLCPCSLPTGLSRQKENVLRDRNVKRGKFRVHSNFPATGISAFWSSFSTLGAWLGHLWRVGIIHPVSLILWLEATLALPFFFFFFHLQCF